MPAEMVLYFKKVLGDGRQEKEKVKSTVKKE